MTNEKLLREKLRKITALFEGAATAGERQAAAAAIERIRQVLNAASQTQPLPETKFSMADQWQRRLLSALCRRYGLEPYRYKGQRYTTVMVRAPRSFVDNTLWPEYLELQAALHSYLNEPRNGLFGTRSTGTRTRQRNGQDSAGTNLRIYAADLSAPHVEMVGTASEMLSPGTNLFADGYGPSDGGELRREEKS